jgi:hypothetical protein
MAAMERRGPSKRTWILLAACLSVLLVSHTYVDNVVITLHGMNVWSALRDGEILNFYAYNDGVAPPSDEFHPVPIVYGFLTFTLIAIWNLPLWLLQELAGVNVFTSVAALTWMKAINLPFAIGTAWLVQRISVRLAPTSRWAPWSGFVFLTSGFLISAVFLVGQFDVMHMFFTVLGLYYLVQGSRRAFVVAFAVAMAIKWFPLFVFLPVLLLVEKRVSRILLCLGGALSVAFAFKLPFLFSANPSAEIGSQLITAMVLGNRLPLGREGVPIFPLLFALVCIACYVRRPTSAAELHRTAIYAGFAGVAAFFVSAPAHPYWFAMLCPFFAILWAINPALARVNLLLEAGLTAAMVVLHQIIFFWTYDLSIVSPMLLPRIFAPVDSLAHPVSPLSLYTRIGLVPNSSLLAAVFTAGIVSLLVLHRPRTDEELERLRPDDDHVVALIHGRTALMLALMLVPAAAYLYSLVVHGTTT